MLPNLRQLVGSYSIVTRQTVEFNRECAYYLDVEAIRAIEDRTTTQTTTDNVQFLLEAVSHYQGDFLEGFYVPNAPGFENWVSIERERLREMTLAGLHTLAEQYLTQQNYKAGLAIAHKLLKLDPWRETAHQQQMFFLACTGQRSAALAQYGICRQMLLDEFNAAPMTATTALYEQIRSGNISGSEAAIADTLASPYGNSRIERAVSLPPPPARSRLSYLPTSRCEWGEAIDISIFYGRETELATLQQYAVREQCRLILVLGIGGIGKTALATKLAQTIESEFECIIWRSLRNAPPLALLLADLVPFLSEQQDSQADLGRLIHWLRSRRCLVILDNIETILQAGSRAGQYRSGYEDYGELFEEIGEVRHQSCILLTSREKLAEVAMLEGGRFNGANIALSRLANNRTVFVRNERAARFSGTKTTIGRAVWLQSLGCENCCQFDSRSI